MGNDGDTAEFAVATIWRWWTTMGHQVYPDATTLLITADAGGSNGYRLRLWKKELAALAETTGLTITVTHMPPGTSKWNRIEHRLFSHITKNWAGEPLINLETMLNFIRTTKTATGLRVRASLKTRHYSTGVKPSSQEMNSVNLVAHKVLPNWNYTIAPRN